ncbi:hypothetical protein I551_7685 [Mycobacterium ulcerans str. Harvey]|uniref:Uncharacterized protein n=1 Tax=Mycobacterium ulcerans str. Harvey TaxID=1299332 RepID=A0ABP3A2V7_MYCUL|nr:hypothetical protein I551_7685 [Mycobacterium ulcerans str. Harvey]
MATTEVAHPLTMLTAAVATAVRELGSTGSRRATAVAGLPAQSRQGRLGGAKSWRSRSPSSPVVVPSARAE